MAAHRIHTVRDARLPLSIRDGTGRDLLPQLAAQDQDYVQPFRGRKLQGLVDEWTMEFDLGALQSSDGKPPEDVRLFLTGWVFPTDTQLNEAILQDPALQPPAPPSLEVPDANGTWQTVRPFIGFPSGKTKAMVVDLSGVFLCDDYRVRIRSSMELYWDAAFFTVNEADAPTAVHDCELRSADLHDRGFSRRVYADHSWFRGGSGPENYDYDSLTTAPRWTEISGRFTRYGAVPELLETADDRLVVMGPGDELTVEFQVPVTEPPQGWTRDFVLYNVGWDKDSALNTVYGHSSEPYPNRSMSQYPFGPGDQQPESEEYRQYVREYQTREYRRFQLRDAVRQHTR
jgi:hypothetical protein